MKIILVCIKSVKVGIKYILKLTLDSWVADEKQKKSPMYFFLNIGIEKMRKLHIGIRRFLIS